jgi:hypothetical protein
MKGKAVLASLVGGFARVGSHSEQQLTGDQGRRDLRLDWVVLGYISPCHITVRLVSLSSPSTVKTMILSPDHEAPSAYEAEVAAGTAQTRPGAPCEGQ